MKNADSEHEMKKRKWSSAIKTHTCKYSIMRVYYWRPYPHRMFYHWRPLLYAQLWLGISVLEHRSWCKLLFSTLDVGVLVTSKVEKYYQECNSLWESYLIAITSVGTYPCLHGFKQAESFTFILRLRYPTFWRIRATRYINPCTFSRANMDGLSQSSTPKLWTNDGRPIMLKFHFWWQTSWWCHKASQEHHVTSLQIPHIHNV